jgi:hypothetical protein
MRPRRTISKWFGGKGRGGERADAVLHFEAHGDRYARAVFDTHELEADSAKKLALLQKGHHKVAEHYSSVVVD